MIAYVRGFLKNKSFWILTALVFFGLVLRLYSFSSITFGYDQARDAFIAQDIFLKGDLKILGPSSDIHGLHHGVLYWYLISPFYVIPYGGIFAVKLFVIVVGLLAIPLTYILTKKMFNNSWVALTSALLITVSYEAISYSHWLSNPSFAFVTILLSFLFLWMYVGENFKYGLFATAFFWGLSVQFEIFLLYQAAVFFIILMLFRKVNIKDIFISFVIFILVILPLIIGEIKFGYAGALGILSFFTGYAGERGQTISEMGKRAYDKLAMIPYYNFFSSTGVSFVFMMVFLTAGTIYSVFLKDKRIIFLLLWFIFPVILFFTGSTNIYFVFIGCAIPLAMLTAFYLHELFIQKKAYLPCAILLLFILGSNTYLLYENKGKGEILFSVQKDMVYDTQTKMLDFIYEEAKGKPFRINTITNPLFINTTWSFLFDTYGRKTYGYMPFYWGYPQDGQFGEKVEYSKNFKGSEDLIFLIHEPSGGIPDFYRNGIIRFEDTRSKVVKSKIFGEFRVEKRVITADKPFLKQEIDESIKNNDLRDVRLKGLE
ncbi:MAG: hypothetical protein KBC63_04620 [Candidatus Levybacteria bacterium]|nr:hypothetical protein [Candidatus Levybacteria bacterium]